MYAEDVAVARANALSVKLNVTGPQTAIARPFTLYGW